MKKNGHGSIEAFTGEEGLDKVATSRPDLILMDIRLPGIDGLETTSRIRKMENMLDVPIIAVTAHAMADDTEMMKKSGFNGCLEKPIDPFTIMDKINVMIKAAK